MIKGIAKEQSDDCSEEDFLAIYKQAVGEDDHGFITIDFAPKKHRFRSGFHTYIPHSADPVFKEGKQPAPKSKEGKGDVVPVPVKPGGLDLAVRKNR